MLARDAEARVFCYADATIRKETQNDAIMRFVDYWRARTGQVPGELVFDSRFTVYANLAKLTALNIEFITLRRRHAALIEHINALDQSAWRQIRLKNIGRAYRTPRIADEVVKLRGYPSPYGRSSSRVWGTTSLHSDHQPDEAVAAQLVDRYARRMIIETSSVMPSTSSTWMH